MAAQTFAALFLAHVIADYLMQTAWLVSNKRRPIALTTHIATVFATMLVVTMSFSFWFVALAFLHLCIDVTKTFFLKDGLFSYILDQALHIGSILLITWLAPDLWTLSALSGVTDLPLAYAVAGGVVFAARGGQFAIFMLLKGRGTGSTRGEIVGILERSALAGALIGGLYGLAGAVLAAKLAFIAARWGQSDAITRSRQSLGSLASFGWALATALPLSIWLTRFL